MKRRFASHLLSLMLILALLLGMTIPVSAEDEALTYDFDNGMQGWTTLDADGDGHDWVHLSDFANRYEYYVGIDLSHWAHGDQGGAVLSGSYINYVGALNPDNYLISPKVNLGGTISFYANGVDANYCNEHLGVFVSTTGVNAGDFEKVYEWTIQDGEWNKIEVDLSGYSGEGYVAIRHFNIYDMYIVSIDDVTIIQPANHVHDFVFTAESDTITATCVANGCNLEDDPTLTIVAPKKQVYGDDLSELATLEGLDDFNGLTGLEVSEDDICYFDVTNRGETELNGAPTDAGSYEARITVLEGEGAVTAVVKYEIDKAEPELTPPEAKELTYNGEDQELITAGESEDGTFEYALTGKDEVPVEENFGAGLPTGKDAGTYYVYYRFVPDKNHENAELADPIEVTIGKVEPKLTAPEAKKLTYNGEDQKLVTAGESEDGTFEYALTGKDEVPVEEDFGAELPTGKDAGTYYVYYRFVPDKNHENVELADPIEVTIAPAVLKITADDQEKAQGDSDPELSYKAEGLFGDDAVSGELAREEGEEPGEYAITIGKLDAGSNYEIEFTGAVLYICAKVPATGDSFNAALHIILMIGALAAAFVLRRLSMI